MYTFFSVYSDADKMFSIQKKNKKKIRKEKGERETGQENKIKNVK